MNSVLVDIQTLSKWFPKANEAAISGITTSIERGKITGLVGPDGAGKTTLIRLMAGLLTPTEGKITVEGYETMRDQKFIHYLIGYMPQKFGLYEDLTVQQNLDLYADLRNVVGDEKKAMCEKLLHFTNLKDFTRRLARDLSGGMKQKLGLACALIKKPRLLLLDEPSVGVDPISRKELWEMVHLLLDDGITVLWSTAYLDEAQRCDSVLLMNEGKLLYSGDPEALTQRMEGRTFLVKEPAQEKRALLFELLKLPDVIDGVIQGRDVRIALKADCQKIAGVPLEATPPRFEDAFIDILGGGPGGESKLAEKAPQINSEGSIAIRAENLTKIFGTFHAVDGISLDVKKGEIFGLLGPNGAGKTTTFKMLCGLLRPTLGRASVIGLDFQKAPSEARARIGYMAQKFSLYGNLSVKQNLEFFAGIYNLKNQAKKEAIEAMVEIFNLKEYLSLSAETLPLGFKQRLSLACATMHHPDVLFLDEPTSGVDPITRREFWNHINGLVGKGVTILITTHFMDEAEYCDRIALIYRGQIVQMDTPSGLKERAGRRLGEEPTLEEAFLHLIEEYERDHAAKS